MNITKKLLLGMVVVASGISLCACNVEDNSGAHEETHQTVELQKEASVEVGMPAIHNFTEKKMMKLLYELRDNANLTTYSYYSDMNGRLHKICPTTSVGYGIPFSAQYTAPQRTDEHSYADNGVIMQPEPNGLYMPDSTSATWVICLSKDGKKFEPTYVEPQVIVSLHPMKNVN